MHPSHPLKRQNRPLVSLTFFKECRQNNVFEDPELGHVKYLGHFEKLFVLFCHLFLLCLEASYVSIAADTAAFKLSVLPDMGMKIPFDAAAVTSADNPLPSFPIRSALGAVRSHLSYSDAASSLAA